MPAITVARSPPLVSRAKRAASRVSSDTLTPRRPAATSGRASSGRRWPLVVITSAPTRGASRATSSTTWARTVGSPPVRRSLRTPSPTKIRARRSISSKLSRSARAWWAMPSSGTQYVQAKLQRSVTDTRR